MTRRNFFPRRLWLGAALCALAGCSSGAGETTDSGGATGTGGKPSAAGGATSGAAGKAASATGGESSSGGASGAPAAGGANLGGFAGQAGTNNGGATAVGGSSANGGAFAASGSGGAAGSGNGGKSSGGGSGGGSSGAGGGAGYSPCPTTGACAVLPLGDSITEGFGSSGAGYRVELFREAVQNKKGLTFVGSLQNGPNTVQNVTFPNHHEGHDGFTIDSGTGHSGISGSITDQAIANYHPNIVLLMIGTNDINGNIDVGTAPNRLGNLIDDITTRAPNALVVVATIIPVANTGTNQKVNTYNAAIPGLVSSRAAAGKHVILVDNYAAFTVDSNYQTSLMYNYLHPNDAGYVVLGRSFFGAIGALLPGT